MAAHTPEQLASPSGPMATPLESEEAASKDSRKKDLMSSCQDPLLGEAPFHGGLQGLPIGIIGVTASFVAGGAARRTDHSSVPNVEGGFWRPVWVAIPRLGAG